MRKAYFVAVVLAVSAFGTPCSDDWNRRTFDDLSPVSIVVGGGDVQVVPSTQVSRRRNGTELYSITLSLRRSGGQTSRPFFRYRYGDSRFGQYWVYALEVCDFNRDGRQDLTFYAGDDTTDVTVSFVNTGKKLREVKRVVTEGIDP